MTHETHDLDGLTQPADAQGAHVRTMRQSRARIPGALPRFSQRIKKRRPAWSMSLNLTPMIDVVFQLLFFFMCVSRFQSPEGMLPARLPVQAAAVMTEIPRTPIRIGLVVDARAPSSCQATIEPFSKTPVSLDTLAGMLARIREESPGFDADTPVHLRAADEVAWDHVVNAYNAAMSAGFEKIFFAGSS